MFDFGDIRAASKSEQIRAWCVEQAVDIFRNNDQPVQDIVSASKMLEDYVVSGDVTGAIQSAVEEGYSEGRFEAKEAILSDLVVLGEGGIEMDLSGTIQSIFEQRGWIRPQEES